MKIQRLFFLVNDERCFYRLLSTSDIQTGIQPDHSGSKFALDALYKDRSLRCRKRQRSGSGYVACDCRRIDPDVSAPDCHNSFGIVFIRGGYFKGSDRSFLISGIDLK